jgi:hypothetical protein
MMRDATSAILQLAPATRGPPRDLRTKLWAAGLV